MSEREAQLAEEEASLLQQISAIEKRIEEIDVAQQMSGIHSFPPNIQAKLSALRKIQLDILDREVLFHRKVHAMHVEYQAEFVPCHQSIVRIVNGEDVSDLLEPDATPNDVADQPKGVPNFWLTVLQASLGKHGGVIFDRDIPVLQQLRDIRCVLLNDPEPGFELQFEFAPNNYFTNEVLTKRYFLWCTPDTNEPAMYNGFEIYRSVGCDIDWINPDHSLTEHPEQDSFFSFFATKQDAEDGSAAAMELPKEITFDMALDFQYGCYIKETLIPRAVFLFLGENPDVSDDNERCTCNRCLCINCLDDWAANLTTNTEDEKDEEEEQEEDEREQEVPRESSE